jgi:hypothetical protein
MIGAMPHEFVPAASLVEASSRMFSLSNEPAIRSRGPKRALVSLARALRLDIDMESTNSVLGRQIADALDAIWPGAAATPTGQITLIGMNTLLEAASRAFAEHSVGLTRVGFPDTLVGWSDFVPARSKLEAVNRISALTRSGPQSLGPGAKERKSVLSNLAAALFPDLDTSVSKTTLGALLAERLGVPWTDECTSTGYTVTLAGLNTVLAGAERLLNHLGQPLSATFASAAEEGEALVATLRAGIDPYWDGRACVVAMREAEYANWRQSEWPGWYTEFVGIPLLNDTFPMAESGGPRRRFGNTTFDYALGRVWDLKAHSERKVFAPSGKVERVTGTIQLNDADAARECIRLQGLGFLVVSGDAEFDDDAVFDDWHRAFTSTDRTRSVRPNGGHRRRRKKAFRLAHCDAYWLENEPALDAALVAGHVQIKAQGRQQVRGDQEHGAERPDKLHLVKRTADELRVSRADW